MASYNVFPILHKIKTLYYIYLMYNKMNIANLKGGEKRGSLQGDVEIKKLARRKKYRMGG